MAKELEIKIKIDGQEIDVAKKSTKELTDQIAGLRTKLSEVPIGSAEFKKIQGDINNLEAGFTKAKNATQPFLQSMSELPGVLGYVGESIQGVKKGFDLLAENPLIAIFTAAVYVIEKVAQKLESMKAVSEALEKAMSIFGTVTDTVVNAVLKPLVNVVSGAIEGITKLSTTVLGWVSGSEQAADATEKYADQLRELNLQSGELAIKQAEATAKINEAKEKAQDANLPLKERIGALKDAKKFEDEVANASKNAATLKVQDELIKLNTSLGANAKIQAAIQSGHKDQLRWAAEELLKNDEVNVGKVQGAQQTIATLYDIDAQAALRNRRLNTTTRGLEKQDESKATEESKKAAEEKKDYEKRLNDFKSDIRLQGSKDEQEKARISLDNDKKKTLEEIETLKMSTKRKAELKKAAEEDYAAKAKTLKEKQEQETADKIRAFEDKVEALEIGGYKKELDRQTASIDMKARQDKIAISKDTEFKKKSAEEQARILALIDKKAQTDKDKAVEDNAKKEADLLYKRIEFERQSRMMEIQTKLGMIDLEHTTELQKIQDRRKLLDEQAKIDEKKEIENLDKLHTAKEVSDEDYLKRKAALEAKYDLTIAKTQLDSEQKIIDARKKNLAAINELGSAIGQLGEAMGKETAAGMALIKIQQALALATTAVAIAHAFSGLGKSLDEPFPANIIAVASTLALIATGIAQFKALMSPIGPVGGGAGASAAATGGGKPGIESSKGYGEGGLLEGPRHAAGGMMVNAEGGEAIMTRGAVTMFGPLLSQLNQAGGGTSFAKGISGSANYDNPKSPSNASSEPTIIKTYVVAQDMNTMNHKQARLKDLSTL